MGFAMTQRPALAGLMFGAAAFAFMAAPASAQSWSELKYNPEIGSRWLLVSQSDSEDSRPGAQTVIQHITSRAEFIIEEKLPSGYRISYVNRSVKLSGTAPALALAETAFSAMKDIVIKARTDTAGRPVVIENFEEVKSSMRTVIDRLAQGFDKNPQAAAMIRQMMEGFLIGTDTQAAQLYLEGMPDLAAGQNTGIAPGAVRRDEDSMASPFGGVIRSSLETRLESFDAGAGKVRYIRKRMFDPEAMKAVTLAVVDKMMAGSKAVTPEVRQLMDGIKLSIESEAVISVEGGMTRTIDDRSVTTMNVMGQIARKLEKKTYAVTRM